MPVRCLVGRVPGLASCALAPRTIRGLVDAGTLTGTLHTPLLPACGFGGPGRGLRTATSLVEFVRVLAVTFCGLGKCARVRLAVVRPGVTISCHTGPAARTTVTRPFALFL